MQISDCLWRYLPDLQYQIIEEKPVESLGILESAYEEKMCSFLESETYIAKIPSNVSMLFLTEDLLGAIQKNAMGYIVVKQPKLAFFQLHNAMKENKQYIRPIFDTKIHPEAKIGSFVEIAKKNVVIGSGVVIEPFVTIYENTVIEEDCIIRSGAKIGGAGFEHKRTDKKIFSVEHLGGTILKNNVEVQNNACIDRAVYPWDNTVIGEYTKIDNLVHIGHAAKLGCACMVVAQSGIGGRTVIGDNVWIGFGTTIRNGISIGCGARINMGSVVSKNVFEGESVTGNFAIPHSQFIHNLKNSVKKNASIEE